MERQRCNLNSAHTASFLCKCADPPFYACIGCLEHHKKTQAAHQVFSLSDASYQVPASSAAPSEMCSTCQSQKATELCFCAFPVSPLCRYCKIVHMSKDVAASHSFVPIALKEKLRSEEDVAVMKQRLLSLNSAESKLRQNISEIAVCEEKFQERCSYLKSQLAEYRDKQLEPLRLTKSALLTRLKQDYGEDFHDTDIVTASDQSLFEYRQEDAKVDMQRLFGLYWESRLDLDGNISPDFPAPDISQLLMEVRKSLEPLLAQPNEDKYMSAFTQRVTQLPGVSPEQAQIYIEEARVHYFKEQYACAKAKDAAISEALRSLAGSFKPDIVESAKASFQQRVNTHSEGLLGKYREGVTRTVHFAAEKRARVEELRRGVEAGEGTVEVRRGGRGKRRGRGQRVRKEDTERHSHHRRNSVFHYFCQHISPEMKAIVMSDSKQPGSYLKSVAHLWKSLSEAEREEWKVKAKRGQVSLASADTQRVAQQSPAERQSNTSEESRSEPWQS